MITYTDGKWIATFDERGSLVKFEPDMGGPVFPGDTRINGKQGKNMIAQLRQPKLRVRCEGAAPGRSRPI